MLVTPTTTSFLGRRVDRIGFGTMRLLGADAWAPPSDLRTAISVLRRAVERGVTVIDTADVYGPGTGEELVAEALSPFPPHLIVVTKGGMTRPSPGDWRPDGRPEHLRSACEASLRRLRTESVTLYLLHHPDPKVPIEESVGALADLRSEGKIEHIGVSNVNIAEYRRACEITEIAAVQNRFNLFDRHADHLIDRCEVDDVVFMAWSPLGGARSSKLVNDIADRVAASPETVALRWMLERSPAILPIPATSSVAHLDENIGAATARLRSDELAALESLASPPGRLRIVTGALRSRVSRWRRHS